MASFFIRTKRKQLFSNWDGTKHRRHGKNNRDHFLFNATSCLSGALRLTFYRPFRLRLFEGYGIAEELSISFIRLYTVFIRQNSLSNELYPASRTLAFVGKPGSGWILERSQGCLTKKKKVQISFIQYPLMRNYSVITGRAFDSNVCNLNKWKWRSIVLSDRRHWQALSSCSKLHDAS